jgi:hypothetical protein
MYETPNPRLFEYKIKTGRSYPNTKDELELYKTWVDGLHGLQEKACGFNTEVSQETGQESEEDQVRWESWHPACSFEDVES